MRVCAPAGTESKVTSGNCLIRSVCDEEKENCQLFVASIHAVGCPSGCGDGWLDGRGGRRAALRPGPTGRPRAFCRVDINDSDKPALQTGGPSGPIVYTDQVDATASDRPNAPTVPTITVWDGLNQTFGGSKGNPQKWINIRGNVATTNPISTLQYTLNGGPGE